MLDHSCQVQRHTYAERGLDLYETPSAAVEALLRVEHIPHCIWEPAAGRGAIVRVLRDHGHAAIASDVYDYGGLHFVGDFLAQKRMPVGCDCILTNPPFNIVEKFVAHALELSSARDFVVAARLHGIRASLPHPREPRARARARVQKEAADDAPRSMGRTQSKFRDGVRVVCVVAQSRQPDHD